MPQVVERVVAVAMGNHAPPLFPCVPQSFNTPSSSSDPIVLARPTPLACTHELLTILPLHSAMKPTLQMRKLGSPLPLTWAGTRPRPRPHPQPRWWQLSSAPAVAKVGGPAIGIRPRVRCPPAGVGVGVSAPSEWILEGEVGWEVGAREHRQWTLMLL